MNLESKIHLFEDELEVLLNHDLVDVEKSKRKRDERREIGGEKELLPNCASKDARACNSQ